MGITYNTCAPLQGLGFRTRTQIIHRSCEAEAVVAVMGITFNMCAPLQGLGCRAQIQIIHRSCEAESVVALMGISFNTCALPSGSRTQGSSASICGAAAGRQPAAEAADVARLGMAACAAAHPGI